MVFMWTLYHRICKSRSFHAWKDASQHVARCRRTGSWASHRWLILPGFSQSAASLRFNPNWGVRYCLSCYTDIAGLACSSKGSDTLTMRQSLPRAKVTDSKKGIAIIFIVDIGGGDVVSVDAIFIVIIIFIFMLLCIKCYFLCISFFFKFC